MLNKRIKRFRTMKMNAFASELEVRSANPTATVTLN